MSDSIRIYRDEDGGWSVSVYYSGSNLNYMRRGTMREARQIAKVVNDTLISTGAQPIPVLQYGSETRTWRTLNEKELEPNTVI